MNFPIIFFLKNLRSADHSSQQLSLEVVCLKHSLKKCDFLEVYEGENFPIQHGKCIELFTSIYLTTGSRVKTAKEINSIIKFKDGGGLLWSKLSAEIPH